MKPKHIDMPTVPCPFCGAKNDAASQAVVGLTEGNDAMPKPGDLSMCFECGATLLLDELYHWVEPELGQLMECKRLMLAMLLFGNNKRIKFFNEHREEMTKVGFGDKGRKPEAKS